ncbi:fungal-specific transcription factor domain-containing protein [Astrocystis sublimbata]|nr:fungal-specific transcription factor domain-containing protein [Astrocystis sublimbata]
MAPLGSSTEATPGAESSDTPRPPHSRRKRSQVTRACDWCRVHRTKCDNHRPCSHCLNKGVQCSSGPATDVNSLPQAFREIERLKQHIRQLKTELEHGRVQSQDRPALASPQAIPDAQHPSTAQPSSAASEIPEASSSSSPARLTRVPPSIRLDRGVLVSTARSRGKTWYGQSSLFHFTSRISDFIASALLQNLPNQYISASKVLDWPTGPVKAAPLGQIDRKSHGHPRRVPPQPFWQSYHTSTAVLNETEFRQHYQSLWAGSSERRKPSALVDIVIALAMQYGVAKDAVHVASGQEWRSEIIDADDATIAGRWHYEQCQALLALELESPSLSTLQCIFLSVIWLCCASFQNTACSTLALAANMAYMLGLHLPPADDVTLQEAAIRKRLWWSIYVLETKTNMKLGRPFLLHQIDDEWSLPGDGDDLVALSGSNFSTLGPGVTWLSWNLHNIKLVITARSVYTAFYGMFPAPSDCRTAQAREESALYLIEKMKSFDVWIKNVPDTLKIRRKDNGISYSADCSALDMERFAPSWVQHQRFLLELLYHNLCVNLWRPFILFEAPLASSPSVDDSSPVRVCARKSVRHAMALTTMLRQILTTTDILNGWHEAFQWQWNCAMTVVGFAFTHASQPLASELQDTIRISIDNFDSFGKSFAAGLSAANVMRKFSSTIHHLTANFGQDVASNTGCHAGGLGTDMSQNGDRNGPSWVQSSTDFPGLDEEAIATMQELLMAPLNVEYPVDFSSI